MQIEYEKKFQKELAKLSQQNKQLVRKALEIFIKNPFDPKLKNHLLKGKLQGVRLISAAYDLRILYQEKNGHAYILMLRVGKHDEVY